jgi:hypothetical protein
MRALHRPPFGPQLPTLTPGTPARVNLLGY